MGRPRKSDTDKDMLETALVLYAANQKSVREIAEITGISTSTINREVKKHGVKRAK
ncbi:MAG: helix-turn-helix domain-containing protein [Clostridia bacterium]|nr:helix-turn-helix domain-containing protein [Clostridia bacterium]